jgi:hypothetical protein
MHSLKYCRRREGRGASNFRGGTRGREFWEILDARVFARSTYFWTRLRIFFVIFFSRNGSYELILDL